MGSTVTFDASRDQHQLLEELSDRRGISHFVPRSRAEEELEVINKSYRDADHRSGSENRHFYAVVNSLLTIYLCEIII